MDLDYLIGHVGLDIGASEEQVKYAVRVLRMDGAIGYDKNHGWYYTTTTPVREWLKDLPERLQEEAE